MAYGIRLHVWRIRLLHPTRDEGGARLLRSHHASAARGVLEAIYWKPQIRWVIDRIHVLNPVSFRLDPPQRSRKEMPAPSKTHVRGRDRSPRTTHRDERSTRLAHSARRGLISSMPISTSRSGEPEGKHLDMFNRRARKGQFFHHPYLGRGVPGLLLARRTRSRSTRLRASGRDRDREFRFHAARHRFQPGSQTKRVKDTTARFFRAEMRDGIVEVPPFHQAIA